MLTDLENECGDGFIPYVGKVADINIPEARDIEKNEPLLHELFKEFKVETA